MEHWAQDGITPAALLAIASQSVGLVADRFGEGDKGGWIAIGDINGNIVGKLLIGSTKPDEARGPERLVEEKIHRLHAHPEHVSSFQSRDTSQDRYGGAIRLNGGFMAFSNLPELVDEAFMLGVAQLKELITKSQVEKIVHASQNGLAVEVYDLMRSHPAG